MSKAAIRKFLFGFIILSAVMMFAGCVKNEESSVKASSSCGTKSGADHNEKKSSEKYNEKKSKDTAKIKNGTPGEKDNANKGTGSGNNQTASPERPVPDKNNTASDHPDINGTNISSEEDVTAGQHAHVWEPGIRTVHHDEVTESVWIEDSPEYDETVFEEIPVYETVETVVCACGRQFGSYTEWQEHLYADESPQYFMEHGSYSVTWEQVITGYRQVISGSIHHEAEGHYEQKVVSESWDEDIITGYRCPECGAVK